MRMEIRHLFTEDFQERRRRRLATAARLYGLNLTFLPAPGLWQWSRPQAKDQATVDALGAPLILRPPPLA